MKNLLSEIRNFIHKRNWQQYHSPKNLAMALTVETAELLEIYQWMSAEESDNVDPATLRHIEEEIGDIQIYLATIGDRYNIDPVEAAHKKLLKNEKKYPA
ncbi:nucleotide pyrophosphohydrolase [Desulforhopalus singaporensis]|uniref:NTP pyrophosphatase, house-cleaning of non-canonical NTPs n=1 Tax=Desulforhopalus singaporensis TaxID=91360 RepID=A0A1H0NC19_9BACT|nr:nucleotide pyrophosphohydrolase [Desulforhopalus singaporensis]SDO90201.1 NTP pyrophosphatase, house-cleaning of non-canonical NTPs [Desulforhopalus singaporensis]